MEDLKKKQLLPFDLRDRQVQLNLALAAIVAGLIYYLYFIIGGLYGFYSGFLSIPNGSYSHAPIIPFISLWLVCMKREALFAAPRQQDQRAIWMIVLALIIFYVGYKAELWRLLMMSLILLLWTIPLYLWGWRVARLLIFPIGFLFFGVPLPYDADLTNPLKRMVSATASVLLNISGVAVEREGARLFSIPHGRFQLEVADACSGINSLIALVTLATVYAYVTHERLRLRLILIAAAIPLALFGNLVRVTMSAVVGNLFGQSAITTFDKFSTFVVFVPAVAALLVVDHLLTMDYDALRARLFGTKTA